MNRSIRRLAALGVGASIFAAVAGSASAAAPTGDFAPFAQCPTSVPMLSSCVYSTTTSGSIALPKQTVPITNPIVFQGGYTAPASGPSVFYGAANGDTLSNSPQPVPGGLLGLTPPNLLPPPLSTIVQSAIDSANGVTATAELVGPAKFKFGNFLSKQGPTVILPVRFQLNNPFLGDSCFIGSSSQPIKLKLTDGTTKPPAGTSPITGSQGTLSFLDSGNLVDAAGVSLVDNTFSVPGATGCGGVFSGLIDPVLNAKEGIPAAAGASSATLNGDSKLASKKAVVKSEK